MKLAPIFLPRTGQAGWFRVLVRVWLLVSVAGLVCILWPETPRIPLLRSADWAVVEGFFPNGEPDKEDLPLEVISHPEQRFWRSWSPATQATSGRLKSVGFITEAPAIALPVVGYPAAPGNTLRLNNETTGEHIVLRYGNLHETWQELVVALPRDWRGVPLTVEAIGGSVSYVGLAAPSAVGRSTLLKRSVFAAAAWHALALLALVLISAPLRRLLAPLGRHLGPLAGWVLLPLALTLLGYAVFFLYPLAPAAVIAGSGVLALLGLRGVARTTREVWRRPRSLASRHPAVALWILLSLLAWLALNSQRTTSAAFLANYRFTPASWSTDNQLPLIVADATHAGKPQLASSNMGPWLVSDRPPAYAGLLVLARVVTTRLFEGETRSRLFPWAANAVGILVMSAWILPAWACLARARLPGRARLWVLLLLALSPFVFFNTVYVWPKLLSASLALTAWLLLDPRHPGFWSPGVGAGLAFAAAILSHGGIFFSHLAMALWLSVTQLRRRWGCYLVCGGVFFAMIAPWQFWVRENAPPGNALMKSAFAGTFGFDEKDVQLAETIARAYRADTFGQWAARKADMVGTWVGLHQPLKGSHLGWDDGGFPPRRWQFFHLLPALGPLLFLLPGLLRPGGASDRHFSARTWIALGALALVVQAALCWEAFALHETAYGGVLLLHLGLAAAGIRLHRAVQSTVALLIALNFIAGWLIQPTLDYGRIDAPTFAAALALSLCAAIWLLRFNPSAPRTTERPLFGPPTSFPTR